MLHAAKMATVAKTIPDAHTGALCHHIQSIAHNNHAAAGAATLLDLCVRGICGWFIDQFRRESSE